MIQIYQYEKLVDHVHACYLERDSFRLYVEQNSDDSQKILAAYIAASDTPGLNQHLIKNGTSECWMYSCNMHSMARCHPYDLLLLRYDQARSFDNPESICQHSRFLAKNAPRTMEGLLVKYPHITLGLDVGLNSFAGGEMYGGFHCYVSSINGLPIGEYKGEQLYISLFLVKEKFSIPETNESITLDIVEANLLQIKFNEGERIQSR